MISARNQIEAKVKCIARGQVNAEIIMITDAGLELCAIITLASCIKLHLEPGDKIYAIIKASEVMLATSEVQVSTRNNLAGTIKAIHSGIVNDEIIIDIAGNEIASTITQTSTKRLGLIVGKTVYALIKASNVMIMK